MMRPSPAVIVSSGPIGVAPCDTHGKSSMPSKRSPTAPPGSTSSPRNSAASPVSVRALDTPPSTGTAGERTCNSASTASVGNEYGSGSRIAPPAPRRSGTPRIATPSSVSSTSAWNVDTTPSSNDAARAAADQDVRREHVVDPLDGLLRLGEMCTGGEYDGEVDRPVELCGDGRRRLEGARMRIGGGRQPARYAHRHRGVGP